MDKQYQGKARTQSPTTANYAVEFPTFGKIAGVSTSGVQWISLALGKPPSWSWYLPCQVSMSSQPAALPQPHTPSTFHTGSLYSPHPRAFLDLPHSASTHFQAKSPGFSPTPRETIWCLSTRSRTSSPCAQISTYQAHFCNFSRQDWIYIGPSLPFGYGKERGHSWVPLCTLAPRQGQDKPLQRQDLPGSKISVW